MPSIAFQDWSTVRAASLDEIENAHRAVSGTGPGRRYVTQQINQAYAVLLLLVILLLPPRYTRSSDLAIVVGFYVLAKITEAADRPIFALAQVVSGHTIKHLAAAAAGLWILRMLQKRRPVERAEFA